MYSRPRPYWKTLLIGGFLLLFRAGLELALPAFNASSSTPSSPPATGAGWASGRAPWWASWRFSSSTTGSICTFRHTLGQRIILDLSAKIYDYVQRLSLSFFERTSTGELMSLVTNDVNVLEHFVTHGTALGLVDLLRLLGGAMVLFARLALLALVAGADLDRRAELLRTVGGNAVNYQCH